MSLYSAMRTGVSGMSAQSNKLGAVSDNIANANTTGYKRASAEFSSLLLKSNAGEYDSGTVTTTIRRAIGDQGPTQYTTSVTDLAVSGDGFFVVSDSAGTPFLTRAGNFVPDNNGNLVNSAGFYLMGYPTADGWNTSASANSYAGLQKVNISQMSLVANPTVNGTLEVNLNYNAPIATAPLASANAAGSNFTSKTSVTAYDNVGNKINLDVYYTRTGANSWEMSVYDAAGATNGGFPYASAALLNTPLTFDITTGKLTGAAASAPLNVDLTALNGRNVKLDVSGTTMLAGDYQVTKPELDGNPASAAKSVEIGADGVLDAVYDDGTRLHRYKIPLATVASPDNLDALSGNVFSTSVTSGGVRIGFPGESGFGTVVSGALEQSNVDMATELTAMIESQRGYTANSKVFQTAGDLLDVLVNLKR
jgi:flagellar hook protein FlgE